MGTIFVRIFHYLINAITHATATTAFVFQTEWMVQLSWGYYVFAVPVSHFMQKQSKILLDLESSHIVTTNLKLKCIIINILHSQLIEWLCIMWNVSLKKLWWIHTDTVFSSALPRPSVRWFGLIASTLLIWFTLPVLTSMQHQRALFLNLKWATTWWDIVMILYLNSQVCPSAVGVYRAESKLMLDFIRWPGTLI